MEPSEYTPTAISGASQFVLHSNLTTLQWQAAVRAVLRHNKSQDQTENLTNNPGGLHPMYSRLQENNCTSEEKKVLLESTMADVLDAVNIYVFLDESVLIFNPTADCA
jgi:hypothetical protein